MGLSTKNGTLVVWMSLRMCAQAAACKACVHCAKRAFPWTHDDRIPQLLSFLVFPFLVLGMPPGCLR